MIGGVNNTSMFGSKFTDTGDSTHPSNDSGGWRYLFPLASSGIERLVPPVTYGRLMGWPITLTLVLEWTLKDD